MDVEGSNQFDTVVNILSGNPWSRKAVIQLFDHKDLLRRQGEVPCTCTLQFFVRGGRLESIVHMRSNDAYVGLPHDLFCFTMIQEWLACRLGIDVGPYHHMVGSMHLYDRDQEHARAYLREGWQTTVPMPRMPSAEPVAAAAWLVGTERQLRLSHALKRVNLTGPDPYWSDLARLLAIHAFLRASDRAAAQTLRDELKSGAYALYAGDRLEA